MIPHVSPNLPNWDNESSIHIEPGVLAFYAIADKDKPTHKTILEIYASQDAWQEHLKALHFK